MRLILSAALLLGSLGPACTQAAAQTIRSGASGAAVPIVSAIATLGSLNGSLTAPPDSAEPLAIPAPTTLAADHAAATVNPMAQYDILAADRAQSLFHHLPDQSATGESDERPPALPAYTAAESSHERIVHAESPAESSAHLGALFDASLPHGSSRGEEALPEAGFAEDSAASGLLPFAKAPGPSEHTRAQVDAASLAGIPKDAFDDSQVLERLILQAHKGAARPLPEEVYAHRILIVPGLGWKLGGDLYAKPNIEFLRSRGVDVQLVETDPLGTLDENALTVRAAIEASDKPVIILGHSKGGLDTDTALRMFPELQDKVAALVTINSPYYGTPWASWLMRRTWVFQAMTSFAKLTHPSRLGDVRVLNRTKTLRQLTVEARSRLPREGGHLRPSLRVYSIATQVENFTLRQIVEWFKINVFHALPRRGSDGVVVVGNAVLPGSRYAILNNVNHSDAVSSPRHSDSTTRFMNDNMRHDDFAMDFTQAILSWVFATDGRSRKVPAGPPSPEEVEKENLDFLIKVGFYSPDESTDLNDPALTPPQKEVLTHGQTKRGYFAASRKLAAKVMAGLSARNYNPAAVEKALNLAADLLALKTLAPPAAMPAGLSPEDALRWMTDATHKRMSRQLTDIVDAAIDVMHGPGARRLRLDDPAVSRDTAAVRELVQDILLTIYLDPDIGHARHAGRALAAALVRYSRMNELPKVELGLEDALAARGLKLGDFIGNRFEIEDYRGMMHRFELQTGDTLGRRTRDLSHAEIAAGARPHKRYWMRAWRDKLLGPAIAIFIDPLGPPALIPGQPVRNFLRRSWHSLRRWLGGRRIFLRSFGHTGHVNIPEADGVAVPWVLHASEDSFKGRIYKSGPMHDFLLRGIHARVGLTRMDPLRAAEEFLRQAGDPELRKHKYFPSAEGRPASDADPAAMETLAALARTDPAEFMRELHRRAARMFERMMALGTGYAHGYMDQPWCIQCSSSLVQIYLLAALFNRQPWPDTWALITRIFQTVGISNADGLALDKAIIWPGSFFVDSLSAFHQYAELPANGPSKKDALIYGAAEYVDREPAPGDLAADRDAVRQILSSLFLARQSKRERGAGWKTGLNDAAPGSYFDGLESLWLGRSSN